MAIEWRKSYDYLLLVFLLMSNSLECFCDLNTFLQEGKKVI